MEELMTCHDDIQRFLNRVAADRIMWSLKCDGYRVRAEAPSYTSRNGKPYKNFGCFDEDLYRLGKILGLSHEYFDGEAMQRGVGFDEGGGNMRRKSGANDADLYLNLFDVVIPEIQEVRYNELKRAYEEFIKGPNDNRLMLLPHQFAPQHFKNEDAVMALVDNCILLGFEGIVAKNADAYYQHRRSADWLKAKRFQTVDLPVIGKYEGKGRNAGRLGGFICLYGAREVRVGSGISDNLREYYWHNPLPPIIEVKKQEDTKKGSVRFGSFERVREDKDEVDTPKGE